MGGSHSTHYDYDSQLLSDTKAQSVEVKVESDGEYKGCTVPRRNIREQKIVSVPFADEKEGDAKEGGYHTIWQGFQRGVRVSGDKPCFGTRIHEVDEEKKTVLQNSDKTWKRGKYLWETYKEADELARSFGAGIIELGAKCGENIGIYSANRVEWQLTALGGFSQGLRIVSLYATLGADAVEYITNHAELRFIASEKANMPDLLKTLPKLKTVTHIIQFDVNEKYRNFHETVSEEDKKKAAEFNVQIVPFSEIIAKGKDKAFANPPQREDLAVIMYTSGTTGNPKGVMLTHANIMASCASIPYYFVCTPADRCVSYLPLAHIFELMCEVVFLTAGASVAFFQNNIKKLTEDWIDAEPTLVIGVPRVFQRGYQRVFDGIKERSCIQRALFNRAYNATAHAVRTGGPRSKFYDDRIFTPLKARLGWGKVRLLLTAAAPCPPYLWEFIKIVSGATVLQGYGMTESAGGITISELNDPAVAHCGPPCPIVEVRLVDVPDMDYLSTDKLPRGEVTCRGPAIFSGYFKDPKNTEATIINGWLHTGDIGRWNPNGTLSIIDRKKNMFKLSQGEYVAAEKIETEYGKALAVGQIWVYGNSFKSFLLAVVVPSAEAIASHCHGQGWWPRAKDATHVGSQDFIDDFKAVLTGEHAGDIKKFVQDSMKEQEKGLKPFERVSDIIIEPVIGATLLGFTEQNGCLTPTFKLRRPQLLGKYISQLKELYAKNGEPVGADEKWPGEP